MTRYIDSVLRAAAEGGLPYAPPRPVAVVGPSRPGALPRLLDGWGLPESAIAWITTPGGASTDATRAHLAHAVAHAVEVYGCIEVWCLVEADDPAFEDRDALRRQRLGLQGTPRGTAIGAARGLLSSPLMPPGVPVVALVASGDELVEVHDGVTGEAPPQEPAPSAPTPPRPKHAAPRPMHAPRAPRVPPVTYGASSPPTSVLDAPLGGGSSLWSSPEGGSAIVSPLGGSAPIGSSPLGVSSLMGSSPLGAASSVRSSSPLGVSSSMGEARLGQASSFAPPERLVSEPRHASLRTPSSSASGSSTDSWGPVGGADWGDVDLPPPPPTPAAPRPKSSIDARLSGVAPAIVDSARTLRRFVDSEVPPGVLVRVMKSRVKTAGNVKAGLKDLCTLVKEHGTGKPHVMDAYRMVDHALPRVREKQGMQVIRAIFGVE